MLTDLRFALRQFAKSRGFTLAVVLSLALGIGANTTVLCWLETLVTRALPGVAAPDRMVVLVSNTGGGNASLADLGDFGELTSIFAGTLASMSTPACLTVERQPQWIEAQIVSANFFGLLGVHPIAGRTFLPTEDRQPGGNPVLVISERLWRSRFGGDPGIIGRTVDLNRHAFTIVGVVPAAFRGTINPLRCDVWAPLSMIAEVRNQSRGFLTQRDNRGWHNLARLQPGVSLAQAHVAVTTANARLAAAYPNTNRETQHRVVPLEECPWGVQTIIGPALGLLLAVSLGVQLLVTANVTNLLLARATSRRKEIAVRLSAGATRGRLIRQFLTESLLLAVAGGAAGTLLAWWSVDAFRLFLPAEFSSRLQLDFPLSTWSLGLALLITLGTGIVLGLIPALQVTRPNLMAALKDNGRSAGAGSAHNRLRGSLVILEVALALLLLVGAALCLKGLRQAQQIDRGFQSDHVLIANLQIGMNGYNADTGKAFYREIRRQLATQPGVQDAALASWFPLGLSGCKGSNVRVDGYVRPAGEDLTYEFAVISPRYFAALKIPLVAGRDFRDDDDAAHPRVAIVNEHFARRFWPGQDPLGRRFRTQGEWRTIVGVAKAGKYNRLNEPARCFFYLPYQQGVPDLDLNLCVRTSGDPQNFAGPLRQTVQQQDPGVELLQTMSLDAYSGLALFPQKVAATLLLFLGIVAVILAGMGVYAVMAYAVSQRTQEFGVRMALGAQPQDVLWLVTRSGLVLAAAGTAVGLALAAAVTRLLSGFLYGISPFDATTFLGVPLLLALTVLLACYFPARRATRVDPMIALRAE